MYHLMTVKMAVIKKTGDIYIYKKGNSYALKKEMATHSSVLAWRILGMGKPGGLPSKGSHRVGHD